MTPGNTPPPRTDSPQSDSDDNDDTDEEDRVMEVMTQIEDITGNADEDDYNDMALVQQDLDGAHSSANISSSDMAYMTSSNTNTVGTITESSVSSTKGPKKREYSKSTVPDPIKNGDGYNSEEDDMLRETFAPLLTGSERAYSKHRVDKSNVLQYSNNMEPLYLGEPLKYWANEYDLAIRPGSDFNSHALRCRLNFNESLKLTQAHNTVNNLAQVYRNDFRNVDNHDALYAYREDELERRSNERAKAANDRRVVSQLPSPLSTILTLYTRVNKVRAKESLPSRRK